MSRSNRGRMKGSKRTEEVRGKREMSFFLQDQPSGYV